MASLKDEYAAGGDEILKGDQDHFVESQDGERSPNDVRGDGQGTVEVDTTKINMQGASVGQGMTQTVREEKVKRVN